MKDIEELVNGLMNKDPNEAYKCLIELTSESNCSSEVYPFMDTFIEMLNDKNSYIRTRGVVLIATNAKWDVDNKIDEIVDEYLKHITDDKPITARQCIKVLPNITMYKPDLKEDIKGALYHANIGKYKDSMRPLLEKDIQQALIEIENQ